MGIAVLWKVCEKPYCCALNSTFLVRESDLKLHP